MSAAGEAKARRARRRASAHTTDQISHHHLAPVAEVA